MYDLDPNLSYYRKLLQCSLNAEPWFTPCYLFAMTMVNFQGLKRFYTYFEAK